MIKFSLQMQFCEIKFLREPEQVLIIYAIFFESELSF